MKLLIEWTYSLKGVALFNSAVLYGSLADKKFINTKAYKTKPEENFMSKSEVFKSNLTATHSFKDKRR